MCVRGVDRCAVISIFVLMPAAYLGGEIVPKRPVIQEVQGGMIGGNTLWYQNTVCMSGHYYSIALMPLWNR